MIKFSLHNRLSLLVAVFTLLQGSIFAQHSLPGGRQVIDFNNDWTYYPAYDVRRNAPKEKVSLPHSFNARQVMAGKINYDREMMIYQKKASFAAYENKRVFIKFDGVNSVAQVYINQQFAGEHKGGYTAFTYEITDLIKRGIENVVTVMVSNAYRMDVLPLSGDFNMYGGIHRPVSLIVTDLNCITPLDYASPGVYISQKKVSAEKAEISVLTKLSFKNAGAKTVLKTSIYDQRGVLLQDQHYALINRPLDKVTQDFTILKPVLWQGKANPYLYQVKVELLEGDKVIDAITQPLGLRYFHVDPQNGFHLNGQYVNLYGFGKHEDIAGKGSAMTIQDHENDFALILESGATALRLTHYPHAQPIYDLSDKHGVVLWTEIPFVGPGGYTGPGYVKHPALHEHAKQVLTEMIRQNYNHPSVIFWGLYNELKLDYDDPTPFLKELNEMVKKEDPYRITTAASFLDKGSMNEVTDVIGWNKYYGWYGGKFSDIGVWADKMHTAQPGKGISVTEYGAGASVQQFTEVLKAPSADGRYHPEEWQTAFHEQHWAEMIQRPFLWGKYIWVFSDFGSSIRTEGDTLGINDKGLITYDRAIKKDAFYFYKANWNPAPMIYIAGKRNTQRTALTKEVRVYTNVPEAELFINGKSAGKKKKDVINRMVWDNLSFIKGKNEIHVVYKYKKQLLQDSCEWYFTD
jgi:beta-galactosidase